jgi:hypothetical protein
MELPYKIGDRVVVRTPDRREYRGIVRGFREIDEGRWLAVVRLDTGWETTYPVEMVHLEP